MKNKFKGIKILTQYRNNINKQNIKNIVGFDTETKKGKAFLIDCSFLYVRPDEWQWLLH